MSNYVKQILEYVVDEFEGYERQAIAEELLLSDCISNKRKICKALEYINDTLIPYNFSMFDKKDIEEDEFEEKEARYLLIVEMCERCLFEMKAC